jgi:hypothetical protein
MDRLAWFPCYASKLLGALPGMSPDERFVYVIALLRIYERNGPCPDDIEHFQRFTGLSAGRVTKALERLFETGKLVMGPDGFMNPFAEATLADMKAVHERQSRAGKNAANIRWKLKPEIDGINRHQKSEENQGNVDASAMRLHAHLHLHKKERKKDAVNGADAHSVLAQVPDAETDLYRRGKEVLGRTSGGLITQLVKAKAGRLNLARAAIETAAGKQDPREYIGAVIRGTQPPPGEADRRVDPRL